MTFNQMNLHQNEDGLWYVDSKAAAHVTLDAGKFPSLILYKGKDKIVMRVGSHHLISRTGIISFVMHNSTISLSNVLLISTIQKNILFVYKLIDDTNPSMEFTFLSFA